MKKLTGVSLVHNHHCELYNGRTEIVSRPVSYAPFVLTIGDKSIKFNDYTGTLTYYDDSTPRPQEEHKYTATFAGGLPEPTYYRHADNSGKMYELLEFCWYDPKIREMIEVHLQSWDRHDLYVWARIHDKTRWEGYSVQTAIATLDDKSAALLSEMYDQYRAK